MQKFVGVKGMNDILPNDTYNWLWLENKLKEWLESYGYTNMRTPILENTALFTRSIGEVTDIVEKEMYSFIDKLNGDSLTMRPEGTAGTVRAVVENNLLYNATQKIWMIGPMFRHERPQKGRYRQFNQLSVEAMGFKGPNIDAEIIIMLNDLWQILGLKNIELQINCLGNATERALHKTALIDYFNLHLELLDEEARRRLYTNPLRILDTKNPSMQDLVLNAPKLIDYLGTDSLDHYNSWKYLLDSQDIIYTENYRLVRGLDYYNLSVFEWISLDLGAQSTVCGGGRYDPLIAELSGKDNYAIGFGMGVERLLLSLEASNLIPEPSRLDIFIAVCGVDSESHALMVASLLRKVGYNVVQDLSGTSLKSQLKRANSLNSKITLIIGENEVQSSQVMVKFMDKEFQELVHSEELVNYLKRI